MSNNTELLHILRRINKLHELCLHPACEQYHLTMMEITIIGFLKNNPGADTAADLVELRMLSKSHVSQAVESLIQKGLIARKADLEDRRKIHLSLLPESAPVAQTILTLQNQFFKELHQGFSEEELDQYAQLNRRILDNARLALERRKSS